MGVAPSAALPPPAIARTAAWAATADGLCFDEAKNAAEGTRPTADGRTGVLAPVWSAEARLGPE